MIRARFFQDAVGFLTQAGESAAAHRLHHDDGDAILREDFILALRVLKLPVEVVQLNLGEIPLAVFDDLAQNLRGIVEGEAEMADASGLLFLHQILIDAMLFHGFQVCGVHGVAQVEVKVLHLAAAELIFKNTFGILGGIDHPHRHFRCEMEAFTRILFQSLADEQLGIALVIAVGCVEIIHAALIGEVDDLLCLGTVNGFAALYLGQTHAAESQHGDLVPRVFVFSFQHVVSSLNLFLPACRA